MSGFLTHGVVIVVVGLSQGEHLTRGSRLVDFNISVGDAECVPASVTDNQVDCRPPTDKPDRDVDDSTSCTVHTFSLHVRIRDICLFRNYSNITVR